MLGRVLRELRCIRMMIHEQVVYLKCDTLKMSICAYTILVFDAKGIPLSDVGRLV
jgi:hypothetical protein